jgi:hypothetical protein
VGGLGLVLSLELLSKPALTQYNVFPEVTINQSIPKELTLNSDLMMELLAIPPIKQNKQLLQMLEDQVELEQ